MVNSKVLQFAKSKLGKKVGSGECFDLADQALQKAGAKTASDYGKVTATADYVWGKRVDLSQVRPGDIIQFRNYKMKVKTTTDEWISEEEQTRPHHTAVVEAVGSDGLLTILEQNVGTGGGRRTVQSNELYFRSSKSSGRSVDVSGKVWFYRPQKK